MSGPNFRPAAAGVPVRGGGAAVEVCGLVKRYPGARTNAVDGVSFSVRRGEVFGLLGPNGAGKTTTVGVLTTKVRPTSGETSVAGVDVARDPVGARSVLAVVPQRVNLDLSLSIRRNLLFHAAYHGVPPREGRRRADGLLEEFELGERADEKPERFSGGQTQRVMIARALMHSPEVLFLDEPTTGLDPQARLFVWERVRDLGEGGVTVLLTTHDMHEAEELCDRVAIMDRGRLLAVDAPEALTRALPGSQTLDVAVAFPSGEPADEASLLEDLGRLERVERVERIQTEPETGPPAGAGASAARQGTAGSPSGGTPGGAGEPPLRARLYVAGDAPGLVAPVARLLEGRGATLTDVGIGRPSLEDVFIHHTGRALR